MRGRVIARDRVHLMTRRSVYIEIQEFANSADLRIMPPTIEFVSIAYTLVTRGLMDSAPRLLRDVLYDTTIYIIVSARVFFLCRNSVPISCCDDTDTCICTERKVTRRAMLSMEEQ